MGDLYDDIYRHATDPRNVIERVKEILGDGYDVQVMYDVITLTNIYRIYNSSSGVTVRVDIDNGTANELGLSLPEFIVHRVRVETLKREVDEPLCPPPSKPTPLVLYFKSKEKNNE